MIEDKGFFISFYSKCKEKFKTALFLWRKNAIMNQTITLNHLENLRKSLEGDLFLDETSRLLYSTDASAYREKPIGVARPKNTDDIKKIIEFASKNGLSIIPRAAGTSLAGQVVGNGLIVDVSKYMNNILEFNSKEHWIKVQPGVVCDELNLYAQPYGYFFGPETSTSNRCMMGGMVGNNSCGAHSIIYGSTRDHLLSVKAILSDGSEVEFKSISKSEFEKKCLGDTLENKIYQNIREIFNNPDNKEEILREYPNPSLKRRNSGYAIDQLLETEPFTDSSAPFNFCRLIAGSEGTLAFVTEITLNLVPLPPKEKALICIHCHSVDEAIRGNLVALKFNPDAVELMDDVIMNCTKNNIEQNKNRFFVQGDPGALLIVEFARETKEEILTIATNLENEMKAKGFGYHFPVVFGNDIKRVWNLRKAGLGLLSNLVGDAKPVAVTEDTAVHPEVLPDYIKEFREMLASYGLSCVYYAHVATGELHLRPVLNLKKPEDVELFHTVAFETAKLVKKYKGSLSGEHGDGRLRGEFIPFMIGEHNFQLLRTIKETWDPQHIFNFGKIIDTPPMNSSLRYTPGQITKEIDTIFDFSDKLGILRLAENCNGSADCRKSHLMGGTMCPSYMATHDESSTTRARANILREFLTNSPKNNPFDHEEIYKVMDLCLSCKACKSECPSSVDVAKLKAEFLQHYYDSNGIPLRTRAIAYISSIYKLGSLVPGITNFFMTNRFTGYLIKKIIGFAPGRSMPRLSKNTLKAWSRKHSDTLNKSTFNKGKIYLFNDEFTNYNDTSIGIKAIQLLTSLGYEVVIPVHKQSGRTFLSKGMLRTARKIARNNVLLLKDKITSETPLLGIEPSAILAFRDEYPDLVGADLKEEALSIAKNALMIDEFLALQMDKGLIDKNLFTKQARNIKFHGHCQQKAVASTQSTMKVLSFPENFKVEEIKSGCCGMAGSFGFEKEHYELSMKVGELILFPEIRNTPDDTIIVAPGTSCRHQIKDGTGRVALHPVEVLYDALL
jgi:FAD/FMN-containing dehydrogenase/Fe-S oxidoreductase